LSDLRVYAVM